MNSIATIGFMHERDELSYVESQSALRIILAIYFFPCVPNVLYN